MPSASTVDPMTIRTIRAARRSGTTRRTGLAALTCTGADDRTDPEMLWALGVAFTGIEWGLLLADSAPKPRYPSDAWLCRLADAMAADPSSTPRPSGHLCGGRMRRLLAGGAPDPGVPWSMFDRLQWNRSGRADDPAAYVDAMRRCMDAAGHPIAAVVQIGDDRDVGAALVDALTGSGIGAHVLFDRSGGRGTRASSWPPPLPGVPCGWAGGLSPATIVADLDDIAVAAGGHPFRADLESRLRTDDDRFDLGRVVDMAVILGL